MSASTTRAARVRVRMYRSDEYAMTLCTRCYHGEETFRAIFSDDPSITGPYSLEVCSECGRTLVRR